MRCCLCDRFCISIRDYFPKDITYTLFYPSIWFPLVSDAVKQSSEYSCLRTGERISCFVVATFGTSWFVDGVWFRIKDGKYLHDVSCVSKGLNSFGTFDFNEFFYYFPARGVWPVGLVLSESEESSILSERFDALKSALFVRKVLFRSAGIYATFFPVPFSIAGLWTISMECYSVVELLALDLFLSFERYLNGPDFPNPLFGELEP